MALAPLLAIAAPRAPQYTTVEYRGTLLYVAHARHPGDVRPYHALERCFTDGNRVRMDGTTWAEGDTTRSPETYLLIGDRMFHRDSPGKPWQTFVPSSRRERQMRLEGTAGFPATLERVTRARRDSLDQWQRTGDRLHRYTRLWAHPRLGDVRDSVEYLYRGSDPLPDSIGLAVYHRDANYRILLRRVSVSHERIADSLFAAPGSSTVDPETFDDDTLRVVPPLVEVAPGLWTVELADIDSRTMIVEFADDLAVLEMAVGSANGERIIDAAHRKWPNKPIRYASFSHYHPHYTGGLRAAMAEGATIITTPGNEAFVRSLVELPFVSQPDRYARQPRPPQVVTFSDRYELADSTNRLVAINYGAKSDHTDEFVLFWFPRQKLMFEAEQGWSSVDGKLRAGKRARALLAWLPEQKLDVERFVQCWPMKDNAAILTRAGLDSLANVKR
jgi:hypothetical protein